MHTCPDQLLCHPFHYFSESWSRSVGVTEYGHQREKMIVLRQYNHLGMVEILSAFRGSIPIGLRMPARCDGSVGHDVELVLSRSKVRAREKS